MRLSLDGITPSNAEAVQRSLKADNNDLAEQPQENPWMIFALQSPMMSFVLASMMFLAGLCSTVYSPLVETVWGPHMKACRYATGSKRSLVHWLT